VHQRVAAELRPLNRHVRGLVAHPNREGVVDGRFTGDYVSRYPPGYRTYWSGGAAYDGYPALPAGIAPIDYMGLPGNVGDGVYYLPRFYDGEVVYVARELRDLVMTARCPRMLRRGRASNRLRDLRGLREEVLACLGVRHARRRGGD
jgi:hypothetical protein